MRAASSRSRAGRDDTLLWVLVTAAAVAVLVAGLPLPLTDGVTAFYGSVARNILATGDWLTLHGRPMPVVDKPPLTFWLMSLSFILFGTGEWALRAWHLAASLGTAAATYALARLDLPRRDALAAAAVLLSTMQFFYQSLVPEQHVPLALFLALAVYWHLRWERGARWWTALLAWLSAAGAVLAIGIAGAVLVALVLGAHALIDRPPAPPHAARVTAAGAALFTAVAAPWFVLGAVRQGRPFVETFFLGGTLGVARFFRHVQVSPTVVPWWAGFAAYALLLPLGILPWTGWLWPALREGWAARRARPSILWTCTLWTLIVVAFLSASLGDKSSRYLLPVFPPLAVLLGHAVAGGRWTRQAAAVSIATALPLLALVTAVAVLQFPDDAARYMPLVWGFLPVFVAGFLAYAAAARAGRPRVGTVLLAALTLASYALAIGTVGRLWDRVAPWRPLARIVNRADAPQARLLMLGPDTGFVDYYVTRPVEYVRPMELAQAWGGGPVIAIVPADAVATLPDSRVVRRLGQAPGGLVVVTNVPGP